MLTMSFQIMPILVFGLILTSTSFSNSYCQAFQLKTVAQQQTSLSPLKSRRRLQEDASFVPPDLSRWGNGAVTTTSSSSSSGSNFAVVEAQETASRMKSVLVPVSTSIHPSGQVGISYAFWPGSRNPGMTTRRKGTTAWPAVVLLHGFDSSALEFRRLGPQLAACGVDTYAVDLLGWGFAQRSGVTDFSAQAKVDALRSWLSVMLSDRGQPWCLVGTSLGGAAAIEVAAASDDDSHAAALVLIAAQGFVDGIGPMAQLPTPLAKIGVSFLQSYPLRKAAAEIAYVDKSTFATPEAVEIGRLHTFLPGWKDALVSFMQSGGFAPSQKVPLIRAPTLILWGRQDEVLKGEEFAPKFLEALPEAELQWIEECGHSPHIEKPEATAEAIVQHLLNVVTTSPSLFRAGPPEWDLVKGWPWMGLAGATALAATWSSI